MVLTGELKMVFQTTGALDFKVETLRSGDILNSRNMIYGDEVMMMDVVCKHRGKIMFLSEEKLKKLAENSHKNELTQSMHAFYNKLIKNGKRFPLDVIKDPITANPIRTAQRRIIMKNLCLKMI